MKKSAKTPSYQPEIPLPKIGRLMALRITMIKFLPLMLFFSYYPRFSIGSSDSMNFEFSIAEIYLLVFALISFFDFKNLRFLFCYYGKYLIPFMLLPLYAFASTIWSPNHLRALLTASLLTVIIFDALEMYLIIRHTEFLKNSYRRYLLFAAVVVSVFCWAQCFLDVFGVSRENTGLCLGCTYRAFGFPHPNGFAIEPQFMGNLLLVPVLLSIYNLIFEKDDPLFKRRLTRIFVAIFLSATLFLTFSRGATYALILGLGTIFLLRFPTIKYIKNKSNKTLMRKLSFNKRALLLIPITLMSLLIALLAQGTLSAISPTNDTFFSGISKSIHQLSLGKIDFRPSEVSSSSESSSGVPSEGGQTDASNSESSAPLQTPASESSSSENSTFSGYVEQSTTFRLELTTAALEAWSDSPRSLIFGTGLGSAGIKMLEKDPELGIEKEIVQNQYVEVLLELGLIGALLIVTMFAATFLLPRLTDPLSRPQDTLKNPLLIGSIVAFSASLCFFSGLPNALHIYLFPLFLIAYPSVERPRRHKE